MRAETARGADTDVAPRLRAVVGQLSRALRPTQAGFAADMTPTRVSVLLTAVRHGPIRLSDVAEREGLNPTMLSRTVAKLSEAELVARTADPDDRRSAWLEATPAGHELAGEIRAQRTQAVEAALAQLSDSDRNAIMRSLPAVERLAQVLRQGER